MVDMQAAERSFRIGQDKSVSVYRFVLHDTIEERIYHRQVFKQYLADRILLNPDQKRFFQMHDIDELFLKPSDPALEETTPKKPKNSGSSSLKRSATKKRKQEKQKSPKEDGSVEDDEEEDGQIGLADIGIESKTIEEIQEEELTKVFQDSEKGEQLFRSGGKRSKSNLKSKPSLSSGKKSQKSEKKILDSLLTSSDLRDVFDNTRENTQNLSTRIEAIKLETHVAKLVSAATENLKRSREAASRNMFQVPQTQLSLLRKTDTQGQFGRSLTAPICSTSKQLQPDTEGTLRPGSSRSILENLARSLQANSTNPNTEIENDDVIDEEMDSSEAQEISENDGSSKKSFYQKSRSALVAKRITGELREFFISQESGSARNEEIEEQFGANKASDFCRHEQLFLQVLQEIATCRKAFDGKYEWRIKTEYL
eukprot:CAMPEP_0115038810 /NCGR_PEP_ID=MMETSP0216-20121206/43636_1 /TAXON_ID=223996 /ORGANISM="Protocruzia adherens, Strain Boccale" /LENGTH=425 /DNA_ID=CAMNT_0002419293 /DNA_START=723 /DNA_END=2000 /DNA_ORIENTATION=-